MIGAPRGGLWPGFPPRRFVCDGPFLVLRVQRGRRAPYVALWMENAELLLPAEPLPRAASSWAC